MAVSFNSGIRRFLLTTWHNKHIGSMDRSKFKGKWGIFDAPEPWGPWTTVAYYNNNWGLGNKETFFYNFSNKWLSRDGKAFVLVFAGIGSFDSWNTVRGTFVLANGYTSPDPLGYAKTNFTRHERRSRSAISSNTAP